MPKRPKRQPQPTEDRAWAEFSQQFREQVVPKLLSSAVFLGVYDSEGGGEQEIKFAASLGLMLLYEKPIILVCLPGQQLPEKLRRIADEVVEGEITDPLMQDQFVVALARVRDRFGLGIDLDEKDASR